MSFPGMGLVGYLVGSVDPVLAGMGTLLCRVRLQLKELKQGYSY